MNVLGGQLILGSFIIVATAIFHVFGLVTLANLLRRVSSSRIVAPGMRHTVVLMGIALLFIIGIHTVEAWMWAAVYLGVGEFSSLSEALYFSVVTSTTLGYGDVTLSERWQVLGSFEAMGGLILFGASTAFLLGLMKNLFEDV